MHKVVEKLGCGVVNERWYYYTMKKMILFLGIIILLPLGTQAITIPESGFDPGAFDAGGAGMAEDVALSEILTNIIKWLLHIMVFLSVLMFVVAGILYITAGDSGRADTAKIYVTYSIIGLIVGLSGWVVLNTIAGFIKGTS